GSASVSVGDTFSIAVSVSGATNLTSFQFDLSFDPSIVEVLGFSDSGTAFESAALAGGGVLTGLTGLIDNATGLLSLVADSMSGAFGGLAPDGDLLFIDLKALAAGTSPLALSSSVLIDDNAFLFAPSDFSSSDGEIVVNPAVVAVPEPDAMAVLVV